MLQHLGIDMTDMLRGEGEWKNMQDVIRNSFRLSFEHLEKQAEIVNINSNHVNSIREDFTSKLNESQVKSLLHTHELTSDKTAKRLDLERLEAHVAELRSEIA